MLNPSTDSLHTLDISEVAVGDILVGFADLPAAFKVITPEALHFFALFPCLNMGIKRGVTLTLVDSKDINLGDELISFGRLARPIRIEDLVDLQALKSHGVYKLLVESRSAKPVDNFSELEAKILLANPSFKIASKEQVEEELFRFKKNQQANGQEYVKFHKQAGESVSRVAKDLPPLDGLGIKPKAAEEEKAELEKLLDKVKGPGLSHLKVRKAEQKILLARLQENMEQAGFLQEEGAFALEDLFSRGNLQPKDLQGISQISGKIFEQNKLAPNSATTLMLLKDHDEYTFRHSVDVANQFLFVLLKMNRYAEDDLRMLTLGALMHDIGKSKIPSYILNKPGPLNDDEWKLMRMHPVYSAEIMTNLKMHPSQIAIGLQHHVKKDHSGYPEWVEYSTMAEYARLSVIADVFQALVTKRSYKKPDTAFSALKKINLGAEDIFDSRLVGIFIKAFGVFPVGSMVRLSSKSAGFVINNEKVSLRPIVVICMDAKNEIMQHPEVVDLSLPENLEVEIVSAMDHRVFFPDNQAFKYFLSMKI